uniref:Pre-mRNA splicing Prp18-interacting factor n=1 Tax=Tanacetum cinerariifolium TaxID=118510 RepID=A0A6L2P5Z0_TANCI|nr:hypothetical protein [Tanacetum cinerariifolium]
MPLRDTTEEFKECSSCGALYTKSCACSKGDFIDKFVCDPNKKPYSSQRPPQDCPKCGNLVDGLYCRHCALLRKKLKEQKFSKDFLNTSESSNDDSNIVNIPQEPIVFNQDPDKNSSQSPPQIDHHCCYGCGDSLDDIFYQQCTCKSCGKEFPQTLPSFHPTCYSGDENSFAYDSNPNLVNDSLNVFNPPSQPPMYSYEFCPHETVQCQPMNYYEPNPCYDSNYSGFDNFQPSQPVIDHLILQQRINDSMIELRRTFQAWLQQRKDQDSLIMRDEHIPEKESDKFIKSSVENLVSNPTESEDEQFISKNSDAAIKSFSPSPIPFEDSDSLMEEIDLSLTLDDSMPSGIEDDDYDTEEDILILEELLSNNSLPLP